MTGRFIQGAKSAYEYPLLLKQLWHTPLVQAPDQEIVYRGLKRFTYCQLRERIGRLASGLAGLGVGAGDTVGVLDWDSNRFLEAYFAVPMMGAVSADGERPSVTGTDRAYDQSRGLVGASRQR